MFGSAHCNIILSNGRDYALLLSGFHVFICFSICIGKTT